jgi:uncharacterized protein
LRNEPIELKTVGLALFFAASALLPSAPALAAGLSIEDQCDVAAGSIHDRTRNPAFPPVASGQMELGVALSACRAAYKAGGDARIAFQLARALEQGGQILSAEQLYGEAAGRGHTAAMVSLGRLLQRKGDAQSAFALYRRAAEAGDRHGAYALGVAYREGVGTAADPELAARWLDVAAAGGYEIAALAEDFSTAGEVKALDRLPISPLR